MIKRLPFIFLAWIIADVYFFQAVRTLTNNNFILWGYWLVDVLLAAGFGYLIGQRRTNRTPAKLISWLMAATMLTLVPKIFAFPVLLIRHYQAVQAFSAQKRVGKRIGDAYCGSSLCKLAIRHHRGEAPL
jgi:hypothetical protein